MAAATVVEDDSVRYYLFPKIYNSTDDKTYLEKKKYEYLAKLFPLTSSYIWQNECFNLGVVDAVNDDVPPHMEGITYYGENIEDEWFIVFLLLQLTEEDDDLIVQVQDSDGDFLLIEAADQIPKWLNPDSSQNRVFLYRGVVHILSTDQIPQEQTPTLLASLSTLRKASHNTRASPAVQCAIFSRLEGYPERHHALQHNTQCFLPATAAAILQHDPQLIGPAVNAFVSRDPSEAKVLRAMRYFPPETRVMCNVCFTRCLYAQLRQHRYVPDRRTGWNLPPNNAPQFVSHDLGLKLACGLEILAAAKEGRNGASIDYCRDVRWKCFLESLTSKGYFKGELEGSLLYQKLLQDAKEYFAQSLDDVSCTRMRTQAGDRVVHLLNTLDVNLEKLKEMEKNLKPSDDDAWMDITPDELEALLSRYSLRGDQADKESIRNSKNTQLGSAITKGLESFVHHTSDYSGAEVPGTNSKKTVEKATVTLNADAFCDAVSAILDFKLPPSDEDSSSMSSYGDEDDYLGGEQDYENKDCTAEGSGGADKLVPNMMTYMDLMDRELAATDVGLSFERLPAPSRNREKHQVEKETRKMAAPRATADSDDDSDLEDYQPVDVDLTALKNILLSYSSQEGLPGPAGNVLSSMGIHLPPDLES
uniref:Putative mads box transcription factor n=1 Tax=Ornithodoros turicata TaxID=34597 RepID=A0A2R5LFD6_9ACAR